MMTRWRRWRGSELLEMLANPQTHRLDLQALPMSTAPPSHTRPSAPTYSSVVLPAKLRRWLSDGAGMDDRTAPSSIAGYAQANGISHVRDDRCRLLIPPG